MAQVSWRDHREPDLDLGDGHLLWFVGWGPDRELNPQYADVPDVEKYAAVIECYMPDGKLCTGAITFAGEVQRCVEPNKTTWDVVSWEPLTISPSVLCPEHGDHGFIRNGKWVRV